MKLSEIKKRALAIRKLYKNLEIKKYGRAWTDEEIALGLVGDIGDLMKLVQGKNKIRDISEVDSKIAHELSDCLWSILVLSDIYNIDLEKSFLKTMDELEKRINNQ